jgi:hypothetical protein
MFTKIKTSEHHLVRDLFTNLAAIQPMCAAVV